MTGIADAHRPIGKERGPRPLLLGLIAATALVLVVLWIRYDPVEAGGVGACPDDSFEAPLGEAGDDDAVVCAVANRDTTVVEFAAAAHNTGLLPVRVREASLPDEIQGVFFVEDVLMWPTNNRRSDVDADLVPFSAFRLGPGDQRLLWIRASIPACEDATADRVLLFRDIPLRTSVFGLPRNSEISLDPPVRVIVERC